jgi:hypothetical protein
MHDSYRNGEVTIEQVAADPTRVEVRTLAPPPPIIRFCPYAGDIFALKGQTTFVKKKLFTKLVTFVLHVKF